jgi:hypothetical protein
MSGGGLAAIPQVVNQAYGTRTIPTGGPGWGARFSQAGDWLRNAGGSVGKYALPIGVGAAALGVGALGARYVAYPLVKGNLDPDLRYGLSRNPLTRALTGEDENHPELVEARKKKDADEAELKNRELRDEERAYIENAHRERSKFDTELAYQFADDIGDLELGINRIRDQDKLTASILDNSVSNYINAMGRTNDAVKNILSTRVNYY